MSMVPPNKSLQRTGARRLSFMSHWFYNIIGFGRSAPQVYRSIRRTCSQNAIISFAGTTSRFPLERSSMIPLSSGDCEGRDRIRRNNPENITEKFHPHLVRPRLRPPK
jgi:hypothetical protein